MLLSQECEITNGKGKHLLTRDQVIISNLALPLVAAEARLSALSPNVQPFARSARASGRVLDGQLRAHVCVLGTASARVPQRRFPREFAALGLLGGGAAD